jgi:hypothetical protein
VRRGWKIVIGVLTAIVVLVVVNTIVIDRDTEPAKADGGRINRPAGRRPSGGSACGKDMY